MRIRFADDEHGVARLTRLGWSATLHRYENTGHTVSPAMQQELYATLVSLLSAQ